MLKHIGAIVIVIVVSIVVGYYYLLPGLPGTDDGIWAPVRLASMYRELRQGQLPVRWSSDLNFGYGYPLFHFSYPGIYYIAAMAIPFGLGFVATTKAIFVLGIVSAGIGIYVVVQRASRSIELSLACALLYLFSPYLITNLYRRGSIGEIAAGGIIPWILLCYLLCIKEKKYVYGWVGAVLMGLLILVHNATALLALPYIVSFCIWQAVTSDINAISPLYRIYAYLIPLWRPMISVVCGLLISSFFWLPALTDVGYTKIALTPLTRIEEWFVSPQKSLFYPFFMTEGPDNLDDYRLSLGIAITICLVLLTIVVILRKSSKDAIWIGALWLAVFCLFPVSLGLWKTLPLLKSVDFPWRMLGPLSLMIPITAGFLVRTKVEKTLMVIISAIMMIIMVPTIQPRDRLFWPDSQYATNQATATSNNEYITKELPQSPQSSPTQLFSAIEPVEVHTQRYTSVRREYTIFSPAAQRVTYSLMWFPGWEVTVDSQPVPTLNNEGLVAFTVPADTHKVEIAFKPTPLRLWTQSISVITTIVVLFLILRSALVSYKPNRKKVH